MDLIVQERQKFGKNLQALRKEGLIPGELYGRGVANIHVAVPAKDFGKVFKVAGESTLINVVLGEKKHPVMIHEVAYDPVSDMIMNVDFYQVRLDEKIKVKVPIQFTGEAPAVKDFGGLLVKAMTEIEVEALPAEIPHSLDLDLSGLKTVNDSLYVKDLIISDTIKVLVNPETVVATATAKMTEEQEKALEAEASVESVKVETEEKKAERLAKQATEDGEAVVPTSVPEAKK